MGHLGEQLFQGLQDDVGDGLRKDQRESDHPRGCADSLGRSR